MITWESIDAGIPPAAGFVNVVSASQDVDGFELSSLCVAALRGDVERAELLVKSGADVNYIVPSFEVTPLHFAVDAPPKEAWASTRGWLAGAGSFERLDAVLGVRVTKQEEEDGLDLSMHGEEGYNLDA